MRSFEEIRKRAHMQPKKTVAVACAADAPVLTAIRDAVQDGLINAVLVGDAARIREVAAAVHLDINDPAIRVLDVPQTADAVTAAVKCVRGGEADILMKGLVATADLLRAVLNKEYGLRAGRELTAVGVAELPSLQRLLVMADGGMHMYPTLENKTHILDCINIVCTALEIPAPRVAAVCAVEVVNPVMQPTVDAAELQAMSREGRFCDMIVEGPLSMDIALDPEAAAHKGVKDSVVAGQADALLMPNIETGNVFWKTLTHFSDATGFAGVVVGAAKPIIMTSRADSADTKQNSILLSILMS